MCEPTDDHSILLSEQAKSKRSSRLYISRQPPLTCMLKGGSNRKSYSSELSAKVIEILDPLISVPSLEAIFIVRRSSISHACSASAQILGVAVKSSPEPLRSDLSTWQQIFNADSEQGQSFMLKHVMHFAVDNGRGGRLIWSVGKLLNVLHG